MPDTKEELDEIRKIMKLLDIELKLDPRKQERLDREAEEQENKINTGISCHSPIDLNLRPIQVEKVEFPVEKYNFTAAQVEADPKSADCPIQGWQS